MRCPIRFPCTFALFDEIHDVPRGIRAGKSAAAVDSFRSPGAVEERKDFAGQFFGVSSTRKSGGRRLRGDISARCAIGGCPSPFRKG